MQHDKRRMPEYFAMKELSSNKLFRPGRDKNIRDYLPLNEPSIQQYMKHEAIVETYWADVRCLDPKTDRPLEIGAKDLEGNAWLSLDHLEDIERTYTEAAGGASQRRAPSGRVPEAVKLQMRIAMEHCDLGVRRGHASAVSKTLACALFVVAWLLAPTLPLGALHADGFGCAAHESDFHGCSIPFRMTAKQPLGLARHVFEVRNVNDAVQLLGCPTFSLLRLVSGAVQDGIAPLQCTPCIGAALTLGYPMQRRSKTTWWTRTSPRPSHWQKRSHGSGAARLTRRGVRCSPHSTSRRRSSSCTRPRRCTVTSSHTTSFLSQT